MVAKANVTDTAPPSDDVSDATPTTVDADALLEQIRALQDRLATVEAERGIAADPVDAHVIALRAHMDARKAANPDVDFSDIDEALGNLPEKSTDVSKDHSELVKSTVQDHVRKSRVAHEMGYIQDLAEGLHRAVLKRDTDKTSKGKK